MAHTIQQIVENRIDLRLTSSNVIRSVRLRLAEIPAVCNQCSKTFRFPSSNPIAYFYYEGRPYEPLSFPVDWSLVLHTFELFPLQEEAADESPLRVVLDQKDQWK